MGGGTRDRRAHGAELERAPACADVLVGAQQIAGPRPCVVAFGRETLAVVDRAGTGRGLTAHLHDGACDAVSGKRTYGVAGYAAVKAQQAEPAAAIDAPVAAAPGAGPLPKAPAPSGVLSADSESVAGSDSRPLLTSVRANA